ncbi:MerR family transcriptional regulator [Lachnospiraceae bacterium KK002]
MNRNLFSIGEFSKLAKINVKCLRYYDQLGILKPVLIAESGYRYYSPSQIILVDAIQLCIDLGIPLKRFHEYYDEANSHLYYNKLFEDGSRLAEQKYQQIKNRLARLDQMQGETKRCEKVLQEHGVIRCRMSAVNLWIEPYQAFENKSERLLYFYPKICDMEKQGVITTYDTGRLIICKENCDTIYNYITVDIISGTSQLPDNIIQIPPSEYFCMTVAKESFFEYNDIFPELTGKNKIIIEAELFTPEYNSENPQYELRCLPVSINAQAK